MRKIIFSVILFLAAIMIIACNESITGTEQQIPVDPASHVPYITSVYPKPDRICKNEEALVYCIAQDAEDDILTYEWHAYSGSIKNIGGEMVGYTPIDAGKNYVDIITCTVHDKAGNVTKPSSTGINVDNCIAEKPRLMHRDIFGHWSVE